MDSGFGYMYPVVHYFHVGHFVTSAFEEKWQQTYQSLSSFVSCMTCHYTDLTLKISEWTRTANYVDFISNIAYLFVDTLYDAYIFYISLNLILL